MPKFNKYQLNQIKRIGICITFAPTFSNLKTGVLQLTFYDPCRKKFGGGFGNFVFEIWNNFLGCCKALLKKKKINPNRFNEVKKSNHVYYVF